MSCFAQQPAAGSAAAAAAAEASSAPGVVVVAPSSVASRFHHFSVDGERSLVEKHMRERFLDTPIFRIQTDIAFLRAAIRDAGAVFADGGIANGDVEPDSLQLRDVVRAIHYSDPSSGAGCDASPNVGAGAEAWRRNANAFLLDFACRWQSGTSAALREHLTYHAAGRPGPPTLGEALDVWVAEGRRRVETMFGI